MPWVRKEGWYTNGQPCPPQTPDGGWDDMRDYEFVPDTKPKPDLRPVVQRYREDKENG